MTQLLKHGLAALSSISILLAAAGAPAYADAMNAPLVSSGQTISTAVTSSETAPKLSQTDAISIATKLFSIPASYGQPNISIQTNSFEWDAPVYNINWQPMMSHGMNRPMQFIGVTLDANTGTVVSFHTSPRNTWNISKSILPSEAADIAKSTIAKLAPDQFQNLQLSASTNLDSTTYTFQFVRIVNQIPVPFDSINVTLDNTGQLVNYQVQWHQATFPSSSPTLSLDKASTFIRQNLGLHLTYLPNFSPYGKPSMLLVYTPGFSDTNPYLPQNGGTLPWVDGNSGEFLDQFGKSQTGLGTENIVPILPGGPTEWPNQLAQPVTGTEAEQIARLKFNIQSDIPLSNSSMQSISGPDQSHEIWNLDFSNPDGSSMYVGIDAENGSVIQYNETWNFSSGGTMRSGQMLSMDDLRKSATLFLANLFPNSTGQIGLSTAQQTPIKIGSPAGTQFTVNYQIDLLKNKIPVPSGSIALDAQTGKVLSYNFTVNDEAVYPDASRVISLSQATDMYLNAHPVQLQYVLPYESDPNSASKQGATFTKNAILVYGLSDGDQKSMLLNATEGSWVTFGQQNQQNVLPSDVSGHDGQKEMELLAVRGILPMTNGMVEPDHQVSRAEFVGIFARASGSYMENNGPSMYEDVPHSSPYYRDIESGLQQGWLLPGKNFYPDKPITRAEAAEMIVRWFNWQALANEKGLFNIPFKDKAKIPVNDQADAAIVASLGIIPVQNGNFNPNAPMSVAETSIAIVQAMNWFWSQN